MNQHQFLAMWDCYGLEYLADITKDNQRVVWEKLKGNDAIRHSYANPMHLRLRAQANPQRNYEIYIFNVDNNITENDLRSMFETSPQEIVNLIRKNGTCFYKCDAVNKDRVKIV